MNEAHILSQLYPDFKTFDIDRFQKLHGKKAPVTSDRLEALKLERVSRWFEKHKEKFKPHIN